MLHDKGKNCEFYFPVLNVSRQSFDSDFVLFQRVRWAGMGRTAGSAAIATGQILVGRRTACVREDAVRAGQAARATPVKTLLLNHAYCMFKSLRPRETRTYPMKTKCDFPSIREIKNGHINN